jgi:hypothetical protein
MNHVSEDRVGCKQPIVSFIFETNYFKLPLVTREWWKLLLHFLKQPFSVCHWTTAPSYVNYTPTEALQNKQAPFYEYELSRGLGEVGSRRLAFARPVYSLEVTGNRSADEEAWGRQRTLWNFPYTSRWLALKGVGRGESVFNLVQPSSTMPSRMRNIMTCGGVVNKEINKELIAIL